MIKHRKKKRKQINTSPVQPNHPNTIANVLKSKPKFGLGKFIIFLSAVASVALGLDYFYNKFYKGLEGGIEGYLKGDFSATVETNGSEHMEYYTIFTCFIDLRNTGSKNNFLKGYVSGGRSYFWIFTFI